MPVQGRRIVARSRQRSGNLMDEDGTLDANVNPTDPGTDGGGDTGTAIGVEVEVGLAL